MNKLSKIINSIKSKVDLMQVLFLLDRAKGISLWLLAFISIIGAIVLVVSAITQLIDSELLNGITMMIGSILLIILCLLSERFAHGYTVPRGGKNP